MNAPSTRFRWLLAAVAVFALGVRLFGIDFDQSHWFHPDERRIAEAVSGLSLRPLQLDPRFFAYGSLPIYVTAAATPVLTALGPALGTYGAAILTGRALSAVWGAATVVLLVLLGRRLYGERTGLLAGLLLAVTVLHVQNSHFATNDSALTFLVLLALASSVGIAGRGRLPQFAAAGLALGFAAATKASAVPLILPIGVAAAVLWRRERRTGRAVLGLAVAMACALAAFLLGEPYAVLDSRSFLRDVLEQSRIVRNAGLVPYTVQYVGVPKVLYDLREMVVWGMGPLLGLAALAGTLVRLPFRPSKAAGGDLVLLAWVLPYFAVTASFDVKFLRYLLPIYPIVILWGAAWLQRLAERTRAGRWARGAVVAGTALYLLAFLTIYARPHTAVAASSWFYDHATPGSRVLSEQWDEGFPLPLPCCSPTEYGVVNFPYYDPDEPAKISRLARALAGSDFVVLQTKRIYGAVSRAPTRFPLTNAYFRRLFAGELGYTLAGGFASRPGLLGIELPDELADESFSVYDHPKVLVFSNTGRLAAAAVEQRILDLTPATRLRRADLLLAGPAAAGDGGPTPVRSSLSATVLCVLLLEILGLAAYAALKDVLPRRPGVYALAKIIGVLLFAYLPWLSVSVTGVPFARPALLTVALLLCLTGWIAYRRRRELPLPRAELVATEAVVWGSFAFFLALRALNPEIFWGEKPMDFSFLNALYRSAALPPPEPWFAGATLSYTYFGHFTMAAVGKALAIDPAVMFNLGIAMTASLTAAGLFAAGALLGGAWKTGAFAAGLTLFVGNLAGVPELLARKAVNFDYFWATSRVIPDTINEFPFWSFVFADLHAHLMALPWTVGLAALLLLWAGRRAEPTPQRPHTAALALLVLSILMLGAVAVTNGWSMPASLLVVAAMLTIEWIVRAGRGGPGRAVRKLVTTVLLPFAVVTGGALLAFLPFWRHFTPPERQWGAEAGPFARASDVLTIFGAFVVLVLPFLFIAWRRVLAPPEGRLARARVFAMAAFGAGLLLSLVDLPALLAPALRPAPSIRAFALALTILGLALAVNRRTPEERRYPLLFAALGFGFVAACEFVFVWDRMNTVFKLYYDAWIFLGLAAAPVLGDVFRPGTGAPWRRVWQGAACLAFAGGLFTSLAGAAGALRFRHTDGPRFTLDGTAYLERRAPDELAAVEWVNSNVRGTPVLVEAHGPSYQDFSRVSMNTGLPIVLGWEYHVFQRGRGWGEIDRRKDDVRTIYSSGDEASVAEVLARYRVALVYVGTLERRTYGGANEANFERWTDLLTPVYVSGTVRIFGVNGVFQVPSAGSDTR